jgi:hypothetical protein
MECWGVRERVCTVEVFTWTGSITDTLRGFRRQRNQQEVPSSNPIRRWVRQWREKVCQVWKAIKLDFLSSHTWQMSEETLQAVMRSFLTRVHLCIVEGGGHLTAILHKKWNYFLKKLSTTVNCNVVKLASITFSKILFLFIISSLFLPHPVHIHVVYIT